MCCERGTYVYLASPCPSEHFIRNWCEDADRTFVLPNFREFIFHAVRE
jgi:hypothetical protein